MYFRSLTDGSRTCPRNTSGSYQSCICDQPPMPRGTVIRLRRFRQFGTPKIKSPPGTKDFTTEAKSRLGEWCQCSMESKVVTTSRDSGGKSIPSLMTSRLITCTPYDL